MPVIREYLDQKHYPRCPSCGIKMRVVAVQRYEKTDKLSPLPVKAVRNLIGFYCWECGIFTAHEETKVSGEKWTKR